MHAHTHTCTNTHRCTDMLTPIDRQTNTHAKIPTQTRVYTHTHTHTDTHYDTHREPLSTQV